MVSGTAPSPSAGDGSHLVLYDGVCGLCNRLTQFLLRHDLRRMFVYASLQSQVGQAMVRRFGGDPRELTTFYVIADYQSATARFFTRSDAALFIASQLGWPWRAAVVARCLPTTIRNYAYDAVARTRYRVFGRSDQCVIPPPEFRSRFLD